MKVKELLIQQFSACYNKNSWFVAIGNAVEGLTAEQAAWKPNQSENSIWETLAHLTFYNGAYLRRFKGEDYKYTTDDNDETFVAGDTDAEWGAAVAAFDEVMTEFRELLGNADESKFDESVPQKPERRWVDVISDINAHNAYHAGQILLLRKLQGSWNPEKGVS